MTYRNLLTWVISETMRLIMFELFFTSPQSVITSLVGLYRNDPGIVREVYLWNWRCKALFKDLPLNSTSNLVPVPGLQVSLNQPNMTIS